ncbi:MAG: hypothetical protein HQ580_06035 [Planctomycetes bacterium]|nr:hypothetical protein [Planctomycetota bacterium]
MKKVLLSILIALVLLWNCGTVFAEGIGKGKQGKQANKENWKTELPPGWKKWDNTKRQQWEQGLNRARDAVRKRTETRLNAALRTLEMTARNGVPLDHAEQTANAGLDNGLDTFDFEPFGKFVTERVKAGVKGEGLAEAIHKEVQRRRQERERVRQQMKQGIKQRQEEHKRLREKSKEKKELGKSQKERSSDRGAGEQEKDSTRRNRTDSREGKDKSRTRETNVRKGGAGGKSRR